MNLSIKQILRESRRLFPLAAESQELYRNILFNLDKAIKNFDEQIKLVGIYTPEYKNAIIPLDKRYIIIDFSLMDLLIELEYIYQNNDWERFRYLYYVLSQEPELEAGNLDKVFFYSALADRLFDEEKEIIIDNSKNMLKLLHSFYFITYHEFFHDLEQQYPHSANYYSVLTDYIKSINMNTNSTPSDIAKEVICDTEAIIQILHTGTGLDDGFTSKNEIFETCLDTLVILSVIQLLLKRLDSSLEITKRIWATFGWINIYLHENEVFQDIDYASIIDKAQQKITLFIRNILSAAKEEQNENILIPDLSDDEQAELLNKFLNIKNGAIIQLEK